MPRISKDKEVTLYAPYAKDIRNLLLQYLEVSVFLQDIHVHQRSTLSFADFKEEWKSQKFSLIHNGKPDDVNGKVFIQELFTTCLGYLLLNNPFNLRVAVLYTLYCLYETQPHKPKVKINVSIGTNTH